MPKESKKESEADKGKSLEEVQDAHQRARDAGMEAQREYSERRAVLDAAYNEERAKAKAEGRKVDGKFRK